MVLDADGLAASMRRASRSDGRTPVRRDISPRWGVRMRAPTVVAAPDGRTSVNPTGNPGMATAGMGDVLSGAIAALLAQRLAPYDAARLAVYAHGEAGDAAATEVGPIGLVAGDVAERLPAALARLVPATAPR
jgi:NAD(P)H-hydrate epimerase